MKNANTASVIYGFVKSPVTDEKYYCTEVIIVSSDGKSYRPICSADNDDANVHGRYGQSYQIAKEVAREEAKFLGIERKFIQDLSAYMQKLKPVR